MIVVGIFNDIKVIKDLKDLKTIQRGKFTALYC